MCFKANYKSALVLVFTFFIVCDVAQVSAQVYNNTQNDKSIIDNQKIISDSSGFAEKAEDQTVRIYFKNKLDKKEWLDSSITDIHKTSLGIWDVNLGNVGGPYQSLKQNIQLSTRYRMKGSNWEQLRCVLKNERYFNTTKPYTSIRYQAGSKQEQQIALFHTQNILPNWNFSVGYQKINSLGFFKGQKNNIDQLSLNSNYASKNKKYKLTASVLYNKLQHDDNLGIADESLLSDPQYANRTLIPVNVGAISGTRSPIKNLNRFFELSAINEYSLSKTYKIYAEDSTVSLTNKENLVFGNEVYIENNKYQFQHATIDSFFASSFLPFAPAFSDTLNITYNNFIGGVSFYLKSKVKIKESPFYIKAGIGSEFQDIRGSVRGEKTINNYVLADLFNQYDSILGLTLNAQAKVYFTGLPKGNTAITAKADKKISDRLGFIGLGFEQYVSNPSYIYSSIQFSGNEQTFNLKNQANSALRMNYRNPRLDFSASYSSLLLANFIYRDISSQDYLNTYNPLIAVQQIEVQKGFKWRKWNINNIGLIQLVSKDAPVNLPLIASRHDIVYSDRIFKGKLGMATGFNVYFNTSYSNYLYQAPFQLFVPQEILQNSFVPRIAYFFNFKVKDRFRASVSLDQMQHFVFVNNVNYLQHPSQNALFRLGVNWIFVN